MKGRSPDAYITKKKEINDLATQYTKQSSLFAKPIDEHIIATAASVKNSLSLSHIEGLLCALYASNATSEDKKTKTHSIKRMTKSLGATWGSIYKPLKSRASSALQLKD